MPSGGAMRNFAEEAKYISPSVPRAGFSRERLCKSPPFEIKGGNSLLHGGLILKHSLCWWER